MARRLLAAFAGTAPAFTREPRSVPRGAVRRLLAAFAGSAPAFTPGGMVDQHTSTAQAAVGEPPLPTGLVVDVSQAGPRRGHTLAQVADEFASRNAHDRLTARIWLEGAEMRLAYQLLDAMDKIKALRGLFDREHIVDLAIPLNRARAIARLHDSTRDLAIHLDVAHGQVRDLADAYGLALGRASARQLDLSRDLARDLTRHLPGDLARLLGRVVVRLPEYEFARDISAAFDENIAPSGNAALALLNTLSRTVVRLRDAASDMVDADLVEVDLGDPDLRERLLDGVRWSTGTRWPAELRTWIEAHSTSIEGGLYKIRLRDDSPDRTTSTA
ncbi:hypothetical protein ALI144C_05265 [Actinosynnema sp. ALI-1.44]|nr:hypothetical protein ALI144C_05265 [Actinosynnema sp. ALI-1.44]